jgi:hypothetical protein
MRREKAKLCENDRAGCLTIEEASKARHRARITSPSIGSLDRPAQYSYPLRHPQCLISGPLLDETSPRLRRYARGAQAVIPRRTLHLERDEAKGVASTETNLRAPLPRHLRLREVILTCRTNDLS